MSPKQQKKEPVTVGNPLVNAVSPRRQAVRVHFNKPSKTVAHLRDQVNINNIVARYQATGFLEHTRQAPELGRYGDFSTALDYHGVLNTVRALEGDFAALPAELRAALNNDPGQLLELMADPRGRQFLVDNGFGDLANAIFPDDPIEPTAPATVSDAVTPPENDSVVNTDSAAPDGAQPDPTE